MRRAYALVEGQTEETFFRDVLAPHFLGLGIHFTPIVVQTKRVGSGGKFRGGINSYTKVRRELMMLLKDRGARAVTTMLDFYGLPDDFPGMSTLPRSGSCYQRVEHLETALRQDVGRDRLVPYLSLHEFEALLLVSPEEIQAAFPLHPLPAELADLVAKVESPEEINDGPETHPAARMMRWIPPYQKLPYGPLIASRIGLATLRRRCPHFDRWIRQLEDLGQEP